MKLNKNWLAVLAFTLMGLLVGLAGGLMASEVMAIPAFYWLGVGLGLGWYCAACGSLVIAEMLYREGR